MSLETLKIVSSIIGMIGGVLGVFVFIDNYILKFKPKFNISNKLYFKFFEQKQERFVRGRDVESVTIKIELINERNRLGRIDDFAVRLYDSRSTSPSSFMMYPENVYDHFSSDGIKDASSFSPISVLGRSHTNLILEFKPTKNLSSLIVPDSIIKMDLLYFQQKSGWKKIDSFSPHYFETYDKNSNGTMEFSLLDSAVRRKGAEDVLKRPKVGIYKGISGKYLGYYLLKPYYWLKKVASYLLSILELVQSLFMMLARDFLNGFIVLPMIKAKSKALPRINFRSARSHLISDTDDALIKCKKYLKGMIESINSKAESEAKVTIVDRVGSEFSIMRGKLEVKLYKGGDGYIGISDTGGFPSVFTFRMEIVELPFGVKLWKFDGKYMSLRSACIKILDSFILLSH